MDTVETAAPVSYITHTQLKGLSVLRVGIGNILTTERHVRACWAQIVELAGTLEARV